VNIGIIGGTGAFGQGLSLRWASAHRIIIGSRDPDKAESVVAKQNQTLGLGENTIAGAGNAEATQRSELVILSVKFENLDGILADYGKLLAGKIVLSPITNMIKEDYFKNRPPVCGSAALWIQEQLPDSRVIAAMHLIPAHRLKKYDHPIEGDVPVCGDDQEAKKVAMGLIREISNLRAIDAGPLKAAAVIEPIVPLLLNLKTFGGLKSTSVRFI
jgi:NADPH-dependent F420 reductase